MCIRDRNPAPFFERSDAIASPQAIELVDWIRNNGQTALRGGNASVHTLNLTIPGSNDAPAATIDYYVSGTLERIDFVVHQLDCSSGCDPQARRPLQTGGVLILNETGTGNLFNPLTGASWTSVEIGGPGTSQSARTEILPKTEILKVLDQTFVFELNVEDDTLTFSNDMGEIALVLSTE